MIKEIAHAKVNWNLAVTGIRADGYHELDTYMQEISLCDDVCLYANNEIVVEMPGIPQEKNIAYRAAMALKAQCGVNTGARIVIDKRIPAMAGLGGGSSDAAATLRGLVRLWDITIDEDGLNEIAASIGADVPFFLKGGLCRARGIGEQLIKYPSVAGINLAIIMPKSGLSTRDVFAEFDAQGRFSRQVSRVDKLLKDRDFAALNRRCANDLEPIAANMNPDIAAAQELLNQYGARFVRMTGSGAAVYGVFDKPVNIHGVGIFHAITL